MKDAAQVRETRRAPVEERKSRFCYGLKSVRFTHCKIRAKDVKKVIALKAHNVEGVKRSHGSIAA